MEAITLFQQCRLDEALASLTAALRSKPTDLDLRYHMVGLLAFRGEFDRALVHLDFIAGERPELATAAAMYESALHGEEERRRIVESGHVPGTDPEHEAAVKARVRLRAAVAAGDEAAAGAAMAVIAAEPAVTAVVDGAAAAPCRDYDDGLGAMLELFVGGRCLWVPFRTLRRVELPAPRGLLDLLWRPCAIETCTGSRYHAHLPVLYAGSAGHADPQVRCGRRTEWVDQLATGFRGFGQRTFLVGDTERPVLDLREVAFGDGAGGGAS